MRNLLHELKILVGIGALSLNNTNDTGPSTDMEGAHDALLVVNSGTIAAGSVCSMKIQESSTGTGSWTDVTGATISIADTDDDSAGAIRIKPQNHKRYLRAVAANGAAFAWLVSADWIISPRELPPTLPTNNVDTDLIA